MPVQNDQIDAIEETLLEVDAANGVLANDSAPNGPLHVAEESGLIRTAAGGQIAFAADGSYRYVSASGFSGIDSVQYTVLDSSDNLVGTGTLTIDVAATAHVPFVSFGAQLSDRHVVTAGFNQIGNGIATGTGFPVALSGGGYVVPVDYLHQANGSIYEIYTFDAAHDRLAVFAFPERIFDLRVAALENGTYAVGYVTADSVSFERTTHVRVFDAAGAPVAGPVTIDVPGAQESLTSLTALPGGGFVALQVGGVSQLYARSFSADGVPESQAFPLGTPEESRNPRVLPNGEVVLTQIVNDDELHVQRYDTQGNPIGNAITPFNGPDEIFGALVTPLSGGRFAVSWVSLLDNVSPPPVRSHVQLVDADGGLIGAPITRDYVTADIFGAPSARITALADGGFTVFWRGNHNGSDIDDEVQAYDAAGNAVGSLISFDAIGTFGSSLVRVFALPEGGFAIGRFTSEPDANNLHIYDGNGNKTGEVRMEEDAAGGSDSTYSLLANRPNGDILALYGVFDNTLVTSRHTVQTLRFDGAVPAVETGITFDAAGIVPVALSIPDQDGSEIVRRLEVTGVPEGWTLTAPTATAVLNGNVWTIVGLDIAFGGTIDLVLTPNALVNGAATLTGVLHTIDGANGSVSQSLPAQFGLSLQTGAVTTGSSGDDGYTAPAGAALFNAGAGIDTMTFGFALTDATVTHVGNVVVIEGPSGRTVMSGFERFVFTDGTVQNRDADALVDDLYYYAHNPDVWAAGADADAHYREHGWREGRDPSAFFSTDRYLWSNPDVAAANADPLAHFHATGWKEGRIPSEQFDPGRYLSAYPDVAAAGVDPLEHFLRFGYEEGRQPFAGRTLAGNGVDIAYYLAKNPDVAAAGVDPLRHFQEFGWKEGRNPNALFDVNGYLAAYADVAAAGVNPFDHYHQFGFDEGRDPSVVFDTGAYQAANPDVAAAGVNPLTHFLRFGEHEGRGSIADGVWG